MMKRNTFLTLLAVILTLLASCRQASDELLLYDSTDANMQKAEKSYAEQFKVLWNAMNTNYVAWEIESIDWDNVYDTYLPQFVALDTLLSHATTSEDKEEIYKQAEALYTGVLSPLHDGHFAAVIKDVATGSSLLIYPARIRNSTRKDYEDYIPYDLSYYVENGVIESSEYQYVNSNVPLMEYLVYMNSNEIPKLIEQYENTSNFNDELYLSQLYDVRKLLNKFVEVYQNSPNINVLGLYNNYFSKYPMMSEMFPQAFTANGTPDLLLCTTKNGIAYMRLSSFTLSLVFSPSNNVEDVISQYYKQCWESWYNKVMQMHHDGTLKGVVFDMRNNQGGSTGDMGYVYGALLSEDQAIGKQKAKSGIGRLDYSPEFDLYYHHNTNTTDAITEPVVVLTNVNSISMAEITTAAIKQRDNGVQIGSRTWGGGCPLFNAKYYEMSDYAGIFGTQGETPVFGYVPLRLCSFNQFGVIEGEGLTPDIEIYYDKDLYNSTGRDNQFERALQYLGGQ